MVSAQVTPKGLFYGVGVYLLWGLFPLYFVWLEPGKPLEIIVHRATWGLIFCLVVITARGSFSQLRLMREPKVFWPLTLAGLLIIFNWTVYVFAILNGATVDAALGYFINPLLTLALAVIILRERVTPLQGVALALGVIAVAVMIIGFGRVPWISLLLASSFALYSLVKKKVATRVPAITGMIIENTLIVPLLLIYFCVLAANSQTSFHVINSAPQKYMYWWLHLLLLVGAGILTATALIIFAKASQLLPLGVLGMLQYISPVMALIIGVFIFHEQMSVGRWVGTGIVWLALIVLSIDMWMNTAKLRRLNKQE